MMKLILPLILFEACLCQMYIPRLSRDPNSRPSIVRFRRPPHRNLHSMEAAPSDTNSRLSLPKPEPFIPGAVAYASRPSESVGEMPLTPRPHYNNYQFTPTEENKSPVQNVDFDGETLTSFQEEVPPLSIEPDNPEEQGFASSGSYEEAPSAPEDSIALGYSDEGNEFQLSEEKKEEINDQGNFHGEIANNYEYVNNEQQGENNEQGRREEEAPSVGFNENTNEENLGHSFANENEEVTESPISKQDYVYEENNVESPEEYFEESPNKEEIKTPDTEPESRTEIDLFEPFANSQVDQIQEFNSRESLNRPFEGTSSTPVYFPFEHPSETSKPSPKLAKSAQSFYTHNQSPIYETKEDTYTPENRRRPTFNLRPNTFEQKEEERFPKEETKTNIFLNSERHEPKEESVSSRSKYSSFNENSIQKFNSFSNTPRIISQPKYQAEESKKRRRPYKPFYEPTPAPYNEEENHLGDYQDYTDDNEKKEPDRLSTLLQQTKFNCLEKNDGYYADEQLECEVFHFCQDKVRHSWLCPSGSSFHQVHLICMPQSDDNICEKSSNFHFVNDYLYKETPESTGRNRTYVQRYYPKGYEGGIAFLEEQQSISKNPSLHKTLSPYEKQQFREANNRRNPTRNYHPQHSVQAHERAPVRDRQKNDIPNYEEDISIERTPQRGYQQNDVNPYEEPQDFDISQTDYELDPDEAEYDTHQTNFEEEIKKFKKPVTHEENNDYHLQPHEENNDYQLQPHKENNQYQLQPLLSTRHENVPFANTPTQGHIRRPQEMFPRPGVPFLLNERNSETVRRVPHPFYRRLGNTFNQ